MQRRQACLLAAAAVAVGMLLAFLVTTAAWLAARSTFDSGEDQAPVETLAPGLLRESEIDLSKSPERLFCVDVPERAVALRLELSSRGTELALSAGREETRDEEGFDFGLSTDSGKATLTVGRFSDPPISKGRWIVRVAWTSDVLPRLAEDRLDRIPFAVRARVFEAGVDAELDPGVSNLGYVDGTNGGFRTYRIDVPPGSSALRIDLFDVSSDLDLYARHGEPVLAIEEDVVFAQHLYGRETLLVGGPSGVVPPGPWYVDVVDVLEGDAPASFRILATLSAEPPEELLAIPALRAVPAAAPVARALAAVVEIATEDGLGSGTILSSDGWILTNAHVVEKLGGGNVGEVVVSASIDARRPPVELFRASVERVDEERDLALVRVGKGFYGQPLPEGYVFPTVELGDPDELSIGDPIWLVGYPSTGGQGSRVSITCTHGVVSGFDTAAFGPVIKTDAEITSGNSGGAALDERGRIVGVPTSLVESGSGQVGFVHPISALPGGWWDLIGVTSVRK